MRSIADVLDSVIKLFGPFMIFWAGNFRRRNEEFSSGVDTLSSLVS